MACLLILMGTMDLLPSRGADLTVPRTWDEYASLVHQALAEGDDARALDLSCRQPEMSTSGGGRMQARQAGLALDIDDAMYRRYNRLWPTGQCRGAGFRRFAGEGAGCSFSFSLGNGSTRSLKQGGVRETIYYRPGSRPDSAYVVVRNAAGAFSLTLDLDLDGRPDLEFDGRTAQVAHRFVATIDRASDGRRAQWLLAMPGEDPRRAARFMLYRDGDFYLFLLDSDGDGKGDFRAQQDPCPADGGNDDRKDLDRHCAAIPCRRLGGPRSRQGILVDRGKGRFYDRSRSGGRRYRE